MDRGREFGSREGRVCMRTIGERVLDLSEIDGRES
jgi:hypothetical protein